MNKLLAKLRPDSSAFNMINITGLGKGGILKVLEQSLGLGFQEQISNTRIRIPKDQYDSYIITLDLIPRVNTLKTEAVMDDVFEYFLSILNLELKNRKLRYRKIFSQDRCNKEKGTNSSHTA